MNQDLSVASCLTHSRMKNLQGYLHTSTVLIHPCNDHESKIQVGLVIAYFEHSFVGQFERIQCLLSIDLYLNRFHVQRV